MLGSGPRPEIGNRTPSGVFRYADARRNGLSSSAIYRLLAAGRIERLGRGVYRRAGDQADDAEQVDPDLTEIAVRAPQATLCLASAAARHGLTDEIPYAIHVAIPRGTRTPKLTSAIAQWHVFDAATFDLGRETLELGEGLKIGIYTPERCIVDLFRLRHVEGDEVANRALKRWLRRRDSQPSLLLRLAASFPKAEPALRRSLEILL